MKNIKPVYVVDITSCKNANDVIYMFAYEKVNAGLPITMLEYKVSIKSCIDNYANLRIKCGSKIVICREMKSQSIFIN